jgi:2-polyprenyl-3-methyl-5-hydroxy-6-metoxy-1,4-benzoquinol methylase
MLPDVRGARGLDIGCGEGANTRTVARLGARLSGIDIAQTFIASAQECERTDPLGIEYEVASATDLPFADASFDFATAFMSLMDLAAHEKALSEASRVIRPRGFLQFSIIHPCFSPPDRRPIHDHNGALVGVELRDYYVRREWVEEWTFGAAPPDELARWPKFRIACFHRTLSDWVSAIVAAGLVVDGLDEPRPSDDAIARAPRVALMRDVPLFMIVRCRKSVAVDGAA